jgi:hypothetical protein
MEIKRVLNPGGVIFSVTKRTRDDVSNSDYYKPYVKILEKYAGKNFDTTKEFYPRKVLDDNGFSDIREKTFEMDEPYKLEDAILLIKSMSLWNAVPEEKKLDMLAELKKFFMNNLVDGFVIKKRVIFTVSGIKQ